MSNKDKNTLDKTIKFVFTTSESHRTVLSNRVFGGVTPSGDLFEMNFMREFNSLPETITEKIDKDSSREESRKQKQDIIRENQVTVYVPINTLISLHSWLGIKINELEEQGLIKKEAADVKE